jgi:hypothetical protein
VSDPAFGTDLQGTMQKVRKASDDVDTVARQMNQILSEKRPLWKMLTGTPGKLKVEVQPQTPAPTVKGEKLAPVEKLTPTGEKLADPKEVPVTK